MISMLETTAALTVFSDAGETLRISRSHPMFFEIKTVLGSSASNEKQWRSISEMISNPDDTLKIWLSGSSLDFFLGPESIDIDGFKLARSVWGPKMLKIASRGFYPIDLISILRKLRDSGCSADRINSIGQGCGAFVVGPNGSALNIKFAGLVTVPDDLAVGSYIHSTANGVAPALAAIHSNKDGVILTRELLYRGYSQSIERKLNELIITGKNDTFLCEELIDGRYVPDTLSDSFDEAFGALQEIRSAGGQGRIFNTISKKAISA